MSTPDTNEQRAAFIKTLSIGSTYLSSYVPSKPGVYVILNTVTSEIYVGSGVNLRQRGIRHRYELRHGLHGNHRLTEAWIKYGEIAFRFCVVEYCRRSRSELLSREQFLLDTVHPNYNLSRVAGSILGLKLSPLSPGHKAAVSAAHLGKPLSEEHKQRLRFARAGTRPSPKAFSLARAYSIGRSKSAETKNRISSSLKGRLVGGGAKLSSRTHCVHGHEFTEENTRIVFRRNGRSRVRVCRTCVIEYRRTHPRKRPTMSRTEK